MSRRTSGEPTDPLENLLAAALESAGVRYSRDWGGALPVHLDFYLPDQDVYIEVKRMHSNRIAEQMARADNVIAVQGEGSLRWLVDLLRKDS